METTMSNRFSMVLSRQRHNMIADPLFVIAVAMAFALLLALAM